MKKNEINNEEYYFAWVIGYELNLKEVAKKYNITECDMLYDFSHYVANNFVNSKEFKNYKYSSYEMFYKFLENNGGIENMFKYYFEINIL